MAYLIHANHWTLSRAYSFVLERRKGISPNIGFVSELMTFEEQELGGKSIGVQPTATSMGNTTGSGGADPSASQMDNYSMAVGGNYRRGGHVRESLPPALGALDIGGAVGGPMSAGGLMERVMGDSGQEMEIKDATGRYRHARRAPVDENTLQPMRRVSKAGLESSVYA
jgi:Dual specificity phosphatase, catalytic domain